MKKLFFLGLMFIGFQSPVSVKADETRETHVVKGKSLQNAVLDYFRGQGLDIAKFLATSLLQLFIMERLGRYISSLQNHRNVAFDVGERVIFGAGLCIFGTELINKLLGVKERSASDYIKNAAFYILGSKLFSGDPLVL